MLTYKEIAKARTADHDGRRQRKETALIGNPDLVGIIAEGEFAKAYGLPFDPVAATKRDNGFDFVLSDGRKVDIKGTPRVDGNLLVPIGKPGSLKSDIYVLAIVDVASETATFIGYATKETVMKSHTTDLGRNSFSVYFVKRNVLRPVSELFS